MESKNNSSDDIKQFYINLFKATSNANHSLFKYFTNYYKINALKPFNDPLNLSKLFINISNEMYSNPTNVMNFNLDLVKKYQDLYVNLINRLIYNSVETLYNSDAKDKRFQDKIWEQNIIFNYIKQSYNLNSSWLINIVNSLKTLSAKESQKVNFYTRLLIDSLAPTNFAFLNPEVMKEAIDTNGQSIIKGIQNFCQDLANSSDSFKISTVMPDAFKLGENIASTEGFVVYQNDLIQLIQYESAVEQVYEFPVLITPAWINKFYIFDLQSHNSFVKWLTEQGYTVFMISWINPDKSYSNKNFYDYMNDGIIESIKQIQLITKCKKVNLISYCLGGTLTACALSYLKKTADLSSINSVTFLTTLVNFENAGDLGVFIDEQQLNVIDQRMSDKGYLEASDMSQTFNMIRANDIIWSFYVNNYLLGKQPAAFDILFWNSDSTRLPAKVHSFYLRNMYFNNLLAKPSGLVLNDVAIDLADNDLPTYILAAKQDHIVLWEAAYEATKLYSGEIRFVLSASGHVAGVINHPNKNKYSFWTNDIISGSADEWLHAAKENAGSWWTDWSQWQMQYSGKKIKSHKIPAKYIIEPAPGSYVKSKN